MAGEAWRYILSVDGRDVELTDGEVTLGRSRTATVRIEHESVSRSHALLTFDRGQAIVKDLNSSNGTYVGGRRVLNETRLSDGDRIQLGAAIVGFQVVAPGGPSDRTALIDDEVLSAVPLAKPVSLPAASPAPAPELALALAEEPAPAAPAEAPVEEPLGNPVGNPVGNPMEISAEELIHSPAGHRPEPAMGDAASALEAVNAKPQPPAPPPPTAEIPAAVRPAPPPPVPMRGVLANFEEEALPRKAVAPQPPPAPPAPPAPRAEVRARPKLPDATLSQVPLKTYFESPDSARSPNRARSGSMRESLGAPGIPENVAGFLPRLAALLVDVVVLLAINILLLSPIFLILFFRGELQTRETGPDMALVAVGILCSLLILTANLWYVVGGWAKTGRTPGKSLLGLSVISEGSAGPGIGWSAAFTRCVCALLSALPLGLGFWVVLFRRDRRGWHDLLAGTWVVKVR